MKESYTEIWITDTRYRLNTKKMAIEADRGHGKKTKWETHVQCKNSPELEAEWKKLQGPESAAPIELQQGWKLAIGKAFDKAGHGDTVATLTAPDGRLFSGIKGGIGYVCPECAVEIDCPTDKDGQAACHTAKGDSDCPNAILFVACVSGQSETKATGEKPDGTAAPKDRWTLETKMDGDSEPHNGEVVGTLTAADGKRYLAVNNSPPKSCPACAFHERECPRRANAALFCTADEFFNVTDVTFRADPAAAAAGTLPAFADESDEAIRARMQKEPDMVHGATFYRVSHNEMKIKIRKGEDGGWKNCFKAETLKSLETFWNGLKEEGARPVGVVGASGPIGTDGTNESSEPSEPDKGTALPTTSYEIKMPFKAGSAYSATVHLARFAADDWRWMAAGELKGAGPECGRFGQGDGLSRLASTSALGALRMGMRKIMDDIPDRLALSGPNKNGRHLNEAFDQLEEIVGHDPTLDAMLAAHGIREGAAGAGDGDRTNGTHETNGTAEPSGQVETPDTNGVMLIDIERIVDSPFQIRHIDPESDYIRELAESIRESGLIHPLAVREIGGGNYELIAGHCRRAACLQAGMLKVKCTPLAMDDTQAETALIVENVQRKNLTVMEEADSIAHLLGRGMKPAEVAKRIGKSEKFVTRRRAMARIHPDWRAFVVKYRCGPEFVERVARLPPEAAGKIFAQAKDDPGVQAGLTDDLEHVITQMEHNLDGCPWAKRHPEWCETCPKRTDNAGQADLFGETEADPDAGRPKCLDDACWKLKTAAYIREQKTELRHEHGSLLTCNHYSSYCYQASASKSNPVPVLILDGPSAGTVRWAPKPQAKPEEKKARVVTEADIRKAAYWETVSGMVKEMKYGAKHGKGKFTPTLETVVKLAVAYGAEQHDTPSKLSPAEFAQVKLAEPDTGGLAAKLWDGVRSQINTWKNGEYFFKNGHVGPESIEAQYREGRALAQMLGLDDDAVEKAAAPVRDKLAAKYGDSKKGARK